MSNSSKTGDTYLKSATLGQLFEQSHEKGWAGLPIVSLTMDRGLLPRDQIDRRVETNLPPESHRLIRKGDLAYNMMRMWQGVCYLASYDCLTSPAYVVIRPQPELDPKFAEYFLRFEETVADFRRLSFGVVDDRLRLYFDDFCSVAVRIPFSLSLQRKIVRILATLDSLIDKTESLIAKYQAIKQGMMHHLLTRGVDAHGHLRPTRAEAPKLYKQSELGWIPKEWDLTCVASEFQISTGFTLGTHRRPTKNVRLYLRVANVQRDEIRLGDVAVLEATDEEFESRKLEVNDLLVVEGHADPRQIGRCALVTPESAGLTFQNHLFRLRSRTLAPRFACDWLNSDVARHYWLCRCATSSGLNTINQAMLKRMPCLVPNPDEQKEIAARSTAQNSVIENAIRSLSKLRQVKTGLMQDLLTGKVRVKVDEAEGVAAHA